MRISDWSSDVCSSDLARCPAGGQEAHVRSAGRGLELQFVAHALEALDDRVATLRLGVAAGVLVDDPAVAPDFVAPAGAAIGARANGAGCIVLDCPQSGRYNGRA